MRHAGRRWSISLPTLTWMTTRASVHHDPSCSFSIATTHPHLLLYIRSVFNVLVEVADMAAYFFIGLEGEGNQRYEAEREPLPVDVRCAA
jgi:hypothetical protein